MSQTILLLLSKIRPNGQTLPIYTIIQTADQAGQGSKLLKQHYKALLNFVVQGMRSKVYKAWLALTKASHDGIMPLCNLAFVPYRTATEAGRVRTALGITQNS